MTTKQTLSKPEEIKRVIQLAGGRQLPLTRTLVMGVLNITPDSFSDGGAYNSPEKAVRRAVQMVQEGADIIDIGGESSRPGAAPVEPQEEMDRVLPVIEQIHRGLDVCLSIDSYRAATVAAALDAGADIINDISALRFDAGMVHLAAARQAPVVLMHMQGTPGSMQDNPAYEDCVTEIGAFFRERIDFCRDRGIDSSRLILDPGIGFGKRLNHNLEILARLKEFRPLGLPLLVGASRKSFIGMISPSKGAADQRLGGSVAAAAAAVLNGADIVRVHDVAQTVEAITVVQSIEAARL